MQLGLLLSIFNSANIPSLFSALRYFLGFGQSQEQKSFPAPSILRQSPGLLFFFLSAAYLITGSDIWFHVTSKAVVIVPTLPYSSHTGALLSEPLGRGINNTKCEVAQSYESSLSSLSFRALSCGQLSGGSGGDGFAMMPGLRTLSNSSSTHHIEFTDDQTAIVVPSTIPPNISYTASTIGIKTTCKSITKHCLSPTTTSTGRLDYGPNAFLNIHCNSEVNFNATHDFVLKALDEKGNGVEGWNISSNPFHTGAVITSAAYYDESRSVYDDFVGNSGWFIHGNRDAWNVLYCDMAAMNVTYTYRSSKSEFNVKTSTPVSLRDARAIITFGLDLYRTTDTVATVIDGAGLQTNNTYEETYALELSRPTVARGAVMYITQDTSDISREEQIIGTRIDLIPFTVMLSMMIIYGCIILIILLQAVITVSRTSYVELASKHLTDPLTTVHALYGPKGALYTWQDRTLGKFGVESNDDRLNVGEFNDSNGAMRFLVRNSRVPFHTNSVSK